MIWYMSHGSPGPYKYKRTFSTERPKSDITPLRGVMRGFGFLGGGTS